MKEKLSSAIQLGSFPPPLDSGVLSHTQFQLHEPILIKERDDRNLNTWYILTTCLI